MVMNAEQLRERGDWLAQLRVILRQGPADRRDPGARQASERRSTKKAVALLLGNLGAGIKGTTRDGDTSDEDLRKVVFNAVDVLVADKVDRSDTGKTRLQALAKFEDVLEAEFRKQEGKRDALAPEWKTRVEEALAALKQEERERLYRDPTSSPRLLDELREQMLVSAEGKQALTATPAFGAQLIGSIDPKRLEGMDLALVLGGAKDTIVSDALLAMVARPPRGKDEAPDRAAQCDPVLFRKLAAALDPVVWTSKVLPTLIGSTAANKRLADDPVLGGAVLSTIDAATLKTLDLDATFGASKDKVLAEAMLALAGRPAPQPTQAVDNRAAQRDPAVFTELAAKLPTGVWNNQDTTTGAPTGLGPRVCLQLWQSGGYDQIAELIGVGVDTSLAARVSGDEGKGGGVYSGFVQPMQHVVSKFLPDIAAVDQGKAPPSGMPRKQVAGAKKILAALDLQKGTGSDAEPCTVTSWAEVTNSEMLTEFKKNPGTIWGFEDIRMPFVQAAHETPQGVQPLRMMELWDAVFESLSPEAYERLLADPAREADRCIQIGVDLIERGLKKSDAISKGKYAYIAQDKDQYIANFRRDARGFLIEFAAQLPKGMVSKTSRDERGRKRLDDEGNPVPLSDVGGTSSSKLMGGIACKAGLWWAKNEGKPVYYCMDGIDIDDVTNYKKVKNKAIEQFIAGGGIEAGAKGHDEVITLVEVREILKHWDELRDTVKFVLKGRILSGGELDKLVSDAQQAMKKANTEAGRAPAPPRAEYTKELQELDKRLMDRLQDGPEGDKDARDIVRKASYLVRMAKSRPTLVLKYLMSRCELLIDHELLSDQIPGLATRLLDALAKDELAGTVPALVRALERAIKDSNERFRKPLKRALIDQPLARTNTRPPVDDDSDSD